MVKVFEDVENPSSDFQNFKQILKKQKQLLTFIESYANIISNLQEEPTEQAMSQFLKMCLIGVKNHRKLYSKYKLKFYRVLA